MSCRRGPGVERTIERYVSVFSHPYPSAYPGGQDRHRHLAAAGSGLRRAGACRFGLCPGCGQPMLPGAVPVGAFSIASGVTPAWAASWGMRHPVHVLAVPFGDFRLSGGARVTRRPARHGRAAFPSRALVRRRTKRGRSSTQLASCRSPGRIGCPDHPSASRGAGRLARLPQM